MSPRRDDPFIEGDILNTVLLQLRSPNEFMPTRAYLSEQERAKLVALDTAPTVPTFLHNLLAYDPHDDLYARLGVSPDATTDEIRVAWRHKARDVHPDLNPGDSTATLATQRVNAAYEVLSDPEQRVSYDRDRSEFHRQALAVLFRRARASGASAAAARPPRPHRAPQPSQSLARVTPRHQPRGPFTTLGQEAANRMAWDGNWFGAFVIAFGGVALDAYLDAKLR